MNPDTRWGHGGRGALTEPLPQRELTQAIRDAIDDLQASVTAREWGRACRYLRLLLLGHDGRWDSAFVRYNIGERRDFLDRFAIEQGIAS